MELNVNMPGQASGKAMKVSDKVFGREFNEPLVHQVVTAYLAGGRAGTKAQKTRAMVSGGGSKPWRQKGTGRARAGSIRSPLWRKGGKIFAAVPRNYMQKVNKKMHDGAMCSIWSELVRQDRLVLFENFTLETHKTKDLVRVLSDHAVDQVMIVSDQPDHNLSLASRNLHKVHVCDVHHIDPVSLVSFEKIFVTMKALKQIEEMLA